MLNSIKRLFKSSPIKLAMKWHSQWNCDPNHIHDEKKRKDSGILHFCKTPIGCFEIHEDYKGTFLTSYPLSNTPAQLFSNLESAKLDCQNKLTLATKEKDDYET